MPEVGDFGLVKAHLAGDPAAFGQLFARHRSYLHWVAWRCGVTESDIEDVLQESALKALRNLGRFRLESSVVTWLHQIVANAARDHLRRRTLVSVSIDSDHVPELPEQRPVPPDLTELRIVLRSALAKLPGEQQAAVHAVDILGMSVREAAKSLGVAPGTVKSRRARARKRLRAELVEIAADFDVWDRS
ncbi:sigma-70 family RNA polymerase sigma factor [Corynebacterium ulceribovis]|uniref:sigma-70 family RNA polymerase sigma factor n=1 Tax=Corynebacterium ulceribovis TaxID=487732 RepID=UPI0003603E3C|nr:sigma-70 family RNA polymerase sigma factor [Corynebacterium ulceribovis]